MIKLELEYNWSKYMRKQDNLKADNRGVFLEVDILVSAEVCCERYAGEVSAPIAVIDRGQVEDKDEHQEDKEGDAEAENH